MKNHCPKCYAWNSLELYRTIIEKDNTKYYLLICNKCNSLIPSNEKINIKKEVK